MAYAKAYCDESYGGRIDDTPYYVVAGYVASPEQWTKFVRRWNRVIRGERLQQIGFHASECIRGQGSYRDVPEDRRNRIQRGLIECIQEAGLTGVVASMDMSGYRASRREISGFFAEPDRKYNDPYVLTFKQFVQLTFQGISSFDRVAFTCDRRPKGQMGRAEEWYKSEAENEELWFHERIAAFSWSNRHSCKPLHAADLLAYCAYRHLAGDHTEWQWQALNSVGHVVTLGYNSTFWSGFLEQAREVTGAAEQIVKPPSAPRNPR
jgi:Protein of unknown function (DUF3800)